MKNSVDRALMAYDKRPLVFAIFESCNLLKVLGTLCRYDFGVLEDSTQQAQDVVLTPIRCHDVKPT